MRRPDRGVVAERVAALALAVVVLLGAASQASAQGTYPGGCYPAGGGPSYPGEYPCAGNTPPGNTPPGTTPPGTTPPGTTPPGMTPPGTTPTPTRPSQNAIVRLKSGRRFAVSANGRVSLGTVSCAASAARCRLVRTRLEVPRRPRQSFGFSNINVKPAQRKTLSVTLTRRARQTLRRRGSLRTRIVVRNGTAKAVVRTVTLRRR